MTVGDKHAGLWKQFAIGELAVKALHKAYAVFKNLVVDSIKGAIDEEKAEKNLQAALEITGRTVEGNLKHYLDWAQAKSKVTLYTHEEIQDAQTLLLTLVNLDQQGTDRAIKGAMGLATVTGMDLHSATMKVILGLKGQEVGLSRVGIKVAENLTAEEKQASLLDQLEKLYQRSTKETETFGGSLKQLKKYWGELLETAGAIVIKNESVRNAMKGVKESIDKLATSPEFLLWLDNLTRLLTIAAREAAKFAGDIKFIAEWNFNLTKADKELAEQNIKLEAAIKRAAAAGHDYRGRMAAITAAAQAAKPAINEVGNAVVDESNKISELIKNLKTLADNTEATHPSIKKLEIAFNNASKTGTILNSDLRPIAERLIELKVQAGEKVPTALLIFAGKLGETAVPMNRFKLTVESIELALFKMGFSGVGATLKLGETIVPLDRVKLSLGKLAAGMGIVTEDWTRHLEEMERETREKMRNIECCIDAAFSGINTAVSQSYTNWSIKLNNQAVKLDKFYQDELKKEQTVNKTKEANIDAALAKEIDAINKSQMSHERKEAAIALAKERADKKKAESEEDYNKKVEAINAESELKRAEIQRKQGEKQKAMAIVMAVINTAEAVTKALTGAIPPWNLILAGIAEVAGAIQIALIKAQPIPLAAGAIFKKPAMLSSAGGNTYEVAEAGEAEIVSSPRRLREAIMGSDRGYRTERPSVIQVRIFLDSREMKNFTVKTVQEAGHHGFLGVVGKAM